MGIATPPDAAPTTIVRLLDADPDLAAALPEQERAEAVAASTVDTFSVPRGAWDSQPGSGVNVYVIAGLMSRRVTMHGRVGAELVGPGDLIGGSAALDGGETTLAAQAGWWALEPTWLGVLDRQFWTRMGAFADLQPALVDRALTRAHAAGIRMAIVAVPNLARRVLLLFWHLADRYGRVGEGGVSLDVPLSHETLAELAGATRPSVSKAVNDLERAGQISRTTRRGYLLHGSFPVDHPVAFGPAATASSAG